MKKSYFLLGVLLVILAIPLFGVTPVTAAEKTEFPCTEELIANLDPGTWTYPNGNIHIRGMIQLFRETGPDPRIVGDNTVVVNANWQSDWTGPIWGTFSFVTDEGGLWEGTWAGQMTEAGAVYNGSGNGYGMYAGMKMWVDMNYGVCTITVLEH